MCVVCLGWNKALIDAAVGSSSNLYGTKCTTTPAETQVWEEVQAEHLPVFIGSPDVSGSVDLSNVISLSVHVCVCFKYDKPLLIELHRVKATGSQTLVFKPEGADCSDRQRGFVCLSGFAGSSWGLTPPVKRNLSPACFCSISVTFTPHSQGFPPFLNLNTKKASQ